MPRFDPDAIAEYLDDTDRDYLYELSCLQVELLSLQKHVLDKHLRVLVLIEGRDAAGKGGAIQRFTQHMNPRHLRVVALHKPTALEAGQWYFQRHLLHLPNPGEIVFFDRSWYNRAVVEPAMGFCTHRQYEQFMQQVTVVEKLLVDDGIVLLKLWYSIDSREQARRLRRRKVNPLTAWKLSPVDFAAHERWDEFSRYKQVMFDRTSTEHAPWAVVAGNDKRVARLESIRYVLSRFSYPDKGFTGQRVDPDGSVVKVLRGDAPSSAGSDDLPAAAPDDQVKEPA